MINVPVSTINNTFKNKFNVLVKIGQMRPYMARNSKRMIEFCPSVVVTEEDRDLIVKSMPPGWSTQIFYFCPEKNKELHIKICANTIDETQKWLDEYQKLTNSFYSVNSAYNSKGQRVFYKKRYHCHHNTRHKDTYDSVSRNSIKNTKCPSNLIISIRKIVERYQGKNRPADPKRPCEIKIKLGHNHPLDTPDILKFKKVLPEIKEQLLQLFSEGYSAATALKQLKETIKQKHRNYKQIYSDRSKCPDYSYCYYLYLKYQTNLKNSSLTTDEDELSTIFDRYNQQTDDISTEMAICEDGNVVCICPPIAKRVYQHDNSVKIVFVDSFDGSGNKIYLFLTPSEIGCLPVGVIVTSCDNINIFRIGLSLLRDLLSETTSDCSIDDTIFITDECLAQDNILTSIWSKSKNYLSISHVLQNVWHWLSSCQNNIASVDRPLLFKDFYNVLYAKTEENFQISFNIAMESAKKYYNYLELLQSYYEKKDLWALYCRPEVLIEENGSIKYSESTVRFLRSNMFCSFKKLEFVPIVKFVLKKFFPYFEKRLFNIASNCIPAVFYSKGKQYSDEIVNKIQVLGANMRLVPSQSTSGKYYLINTDLLTCTCPNANPSSICKHVHCVSMVLYQNTFEQNCQNINTQKKCYYLATGEQLEIPEDPLKIPEGSNEETVEEHQEEMQIDTQQDEARKECNEIWTDVSSVLENFVQVSATEFAPILGEIASKFEAASSVADLRSSFNIFETSNSKRTSKKPLNLDPDQIEETVD